MNITLLGLNVLGAKTSVVPQSWLTITEVNQIQ